MPKNHTLDENLTDQEFDKHSELKIPKIEDLGYKPLEIVRVFDAPKEFLFKMFTEAEHFKNWFGNQMTKVTQCEFDFRIGGKLFILIKSSNGFSSTLEGKFYEIIENEKLVYSTGGFKNKEGLNQIEFLNTVIFNDYNGKTELILQSQVIKAEIDKPKRAIQGMYDGWPTNLDNLKIYVENQLNKG